MEIKKLKWMAAALALIIVAAAIYSFHNKSGGGASTSEDNEDNDEEISVGNHASAAGCSPWHRSSIGTGSAGPRPDPYL